MIESLFLEIGLILILTTLVATVFKILKQPLIIAYILAGILLGPAVFDLVQSSDAVTAFAHLGIALLLFIVGLKFRQGLHLIPENCEISPPDIQIGQNTLFVCSFFGFLQDTNQRFFSHISS